MLRPRVFLPFVLRSALLLISTLFSTNGRSQTVPSGFSDALVMGNWNQPVGFTFDANGRTYVWEKWGQVWIVENGVKLNPPLVDITEEVGNWGDHGLLGFALDPNFTSNGRIYLMYVVDRYYALNYGQPGYDQYANLPNTAQFIRITRYTATGPAHNTVDVNSRTVLFGETMQTGAAITYGSHGAGTLLFGTDGTLLASMGDGASYDVVDVGSDGSTYFQQALTDGILTTKTNVGAMRAQLIDCANGKVLRLDPNTGDGIASNPFYDALHPRAMKSRVWAMGLRNPYRMTLRPGTGNADPSLGQPGTIIIGDVGWQQWEELNVCHEGGMNFGWPIYEGMNAQPGYLAALTANLDAPNPLFGQGGCTQEYFNFQDLLKQDTPVHLNGHPNPCNSSVQVPPSIPVFFNDRADVDWFHGNESRCAGFSGTTAVTFDLDSANSPVPGPRFGGNASVGGTWITGTGWPVGYQNAYFHADYGQAWIRRFTFDATNDEVTQVANFGSSMGAVVCLKEGPDGALWYIRYETNAIRKISPIGVTNLPPIASAQQSTQFGSSPLTVNFTSTGSSDPENGALTYAWAFGDGGTSTSASPSHTWTVNGGVAASFTVTLIVTDDHALTNTTTLLVSVNNTPPTASITSFPNGHQYPVGVDTTYSLQASVSDAQTPTQITYAWQTILHHNGHTHPGPIVNTTSATAVITGIGCYSDTYFYEVKLTVTDPGGLSATVTDLLYPRCSSIAPTAVISSTSDFGEGPFTAILNGSASVDNGSIVSYAWDFGDGTSATGDTVSKTFTDPGDYYVTLRVIDNDGLIGTTTKVINVLSFDPPQCVGSAGSVLREFWLNIAGANVVDLTSNTAYPDNPGGSSFPTQFSAPFNFGNDYGTRMRGYVIAPNDGTYYFTVTSEDASVLYMSLNADPKYKRVICNVPGFTAQNELNKYPSQRSAAIALKQGVYYYMEFIQKAASTTSDNMAVRWERPGFATPTVIASSFLARWQDCLPSVTMRAELQGPFDASTNLMHDDLRTASLIPTIEPFTGLGFTQIGGGGETVPIAMLATTGKNAIVDWVLVELRNKNTPSTIMATRSALLQRDGDIVGTNNDPRLLFNVASDNYYVAVRHRNHLGAMTATAIALGKNAMGIDFSAMGTATYGTNARTALGLARMGLWSGNVQRDTQIKYTAASNDRDPILVQIEGTVPTNTFAGYVQSDTNLDGLVKYTGLNNDRDPILINIGGTIPTNTRTEQLP